MHVLTSRRIAKKLRSALTILERENTPQEYDKAIEELRGLAKEVKVNYVKKPIPKEAWDNFWAGVIGDFITDFEHNAVNRELSNEDFSEAFLEGMAKGMWTIYNKIEEVMVREK